MTRGSVDLSGSILVTCWVTNNLNLNPVYLVVFIYRAVVIIEAIEFNVLITVAS